MDDDKDTMDEKLCRIIDMAMINGSIDGAHHKKWVIDQILRIALGDKYDAKIAEYEDGEDGPHTYGWDTGIAP
jgi:hypothetical protein